MSIRTTLLGSATVAALIAAPLTPAMAQSSGDDMTDNGMTTEPSQEMAFTDDQLTSFAEAAMKVVALRETYVGQIEATQDETERQALAQQAQQEMVTAIEDTDGITVESCNEIGEAAQNNPALNQRIVALLQEEGMMDGG